MYCILSFNIYSYAYLCLYFILSIALYSLLMICLFSCFNLCSYLGLYVSLKPGGLLIFHDRYYSNSQVTDGDIYHPIRIKRKVLDHFLSLFDIIFNNCDADYDGRKDSGYYVIARKR